MIDKVEGEGPKNYLITDVSHCARCGEDHKGLDFSPFSRAPIQDDDGTIWGWWTMCPVTHEPILLKADPHDQC